MEEPPGSVPVTPGTLPLLLPAAADVVLGVTEALLLLLPPPPAAAGVVVDVPGTLLLLLPPPPAVAGVVVVDVPLEAEAAAADDDDGSPVGELLTFPPFWTTGSLV